MSVYQQDNALIYKVFPASLDEGSVAWFQQLPPVSVTFFAELSTQFTQAYALYIWELKCIDSLFEIMKHSQELFKQYVDHFKTTLKLIINLN